MFIVSLNYIKPLEEVDRYIPEHVEYLKRHYQSGDFLLSGRKLPRTGGVILAKTTSRETLNNILNQDPFWRENLATYEVIEIEPMMSSKELEFLTNCAN